ncbi:uncharacterized protein RHOBADRAFT_42259 [Rhodotorula graminis WP1]|uniref:Xaa-Pro dipeptidyl-peptidase-like domain-containing protein n=1 Tax=Rhodotorula graminis (strain WP1) TaxID=578459 RepID=A0A194SCC8_RHOGW|nr:uncharacterized protein RHOBADRAFT_42259 [Rhodotorula graminis WP1]KPV77046.1 hypothetical protein RHOBADRAFT_42259 [Rhodotorula graminis WP1]
MAHTVQHGTHTLRAGSPTLSYALHRPTAAPRRAAALIAHPYGRLGGSKDDHVVRALADLLVDEGFLVVRYDARGAGESTGSTSWRGAAEAADFRELVDDLVLPLLFPRVAAPSSSATTYDLLLCGYSFGSLAASSSPPPAAPTSAPAAAAAAAAASSTLRTSYLLLSYPLSVLWALTALHPGPATTALRSLVERGEARVLAVHGTRDDFSGVERLRRWAADFERAAPARGQAEGLWRAVEVEGADHFWRDGESKSEMLEAVRGWVREGVARPGME